MDFCVCVCAWKIRLFCIIESDSESYETYSYCFGIVRDLEMMSDIVQRDGDREKK